MKLAMAIENNWKKAEQDKELRHQRDLDKARGRASEILKENMTHLGDRARERARTIENERLFLDMKMKEE